MNSGAYAKHEFVKLARIAAWLKVVQCEYAVERELLANTYIVRMP